jgi:hypothetical protein
MSTTRLPDLFDVPKPEPITINPKAPIATQI